jgi:hypothetical protein
MQMVGIDDYGLAAGPLKPADDIIEQRPTGDRKKGFRCVVGIRPQASAIPGGQYHCFHRSGFRIQGSEVQGCRGPEERPVKSKKETNERRASNIEYCILSFYKKSGQHAAQSFALREQIRPSKIYCLSITISA